MCACNGINPSDVLTQSRGGYRKQVTLLAQQKKVSKSNDKTRTKVKIRSMIKSNNKMKKISQLHKACLLESAQSKQHVNHRRKYRNV